jgi:hypothetical protein
MIHVPKRFVRVDCILKACASENSNSEFESALMAHKDYTLDPYYSLDYDLIKRHNTLSYWTAEQLHPDDDLT